jgi:tetratricopeptide (TPR) repeat protein
MLSGEGDNQESLGLAMLARGMMGELSASLRHALKLSAAAQASDNPAIGDALLFTYAQGLSGVYISNKTFPSRYDRLSDEDRSLLEKDPLLENMILSCWQWQKKTYDEALASAGKALAIGNGWSNLHYIRGCVLVDQKKYENALDEYLTTLSLNRVNPVAWFMLGHTYDRLKRYEESAAAFSAVLEYIPNSDHNLDYYGVALHAEWAIRDLRDYVGKEVLP